MAATLSDGASAVVADGLTKRYGDKVAVDDLCLAIEPGEIFGLLGPNGAGKTTTILMLLGLTEPTSGQARVDGLDPTRQPLEVKARVGYLPDDVGFYDSLTGRQNLQYTADLNRIEVAEADARIDVLLDEVGLTVDADRQVGAYSRGMRQRLGLADALVKRPSILILDEPTVNIDPEGVRELLALVERLSHDEGVTVLLSSHLLHQVEQVCDRLGIFVGGRLAAVGSVDELAAAMPERWFFSVAMSGTDYAVESLLIGLDGVASVRRNDQLWTITADRDVRAALGRTAVASGLVVTHLSHRSADLDAIYHHHFGGPHDGDRHP